MQQEANTSFHITTPYVPPKSLFPFYSTHTKSVYISQSLSIYEIIPVQIYEVGILTTSKVCCLYTGEIPHTLS